jgi:hypothetical protein
MHRMKSPSRNHTTSVACQPGSYIRPRRCPRPIAMHALVAAITRLSPGVYRRHMDAWSTATNKTICTTGLFPLQPGCHRSEKRPNLIDIRPTHSPPLDPPPTSPAYALPTSHIIMAATIRLIYYNIRILSCLWPVIYYIDSVVF